MNSLPMDTTGGWGRRRIGLLFVGSALVTVVVHAVFLPAYLPGFFTLALPFLLVGWASFGLAWYALGRYVGGPDRMPSMRAADAGVALFLGSVIVAGVLDTTGFTLESTPVAHLLPAVGIYVGLALAGWGIGERSRIINDTADDGE